MSKSTDSEKMANTSICSHVDIRHEALEVLAQVHHVGREDARVFHWLFFPFFIGITPTHELVWYAHNGGDVLGHLDLIDDEIRNWYWQGKFGEIYLHVLNVLGRLQLLHAFQGGVLGECVHHWFMALPLRANDCLQNCVSEFWLSNKEAKAINKEAKIIPSVRVLFYLRWDVGIRCEPESVLGHDPVVGDGIPLNWFRNSQCIIIEQSVDSRGNTSDTFHWFLLLL